MKRWPTITVCLVTLLVLVGAMVACQAPAPTTPTAAPKPAATTTPTATAIATPTATATPTAKAEPIKLGVVSPASAFLADYGVSWTNGLQIAVDQINAAGGVLGRPLQLVVRDNKSKVDVALSETKALYYNEGIRIMFGNIPQTAVIAMGDFAKQEKFLLMGSAGGDITGPTGHRYIFKAVGMQSYSTARMVAEYAATKHPEWTKWYILVSDYLFPHESADYFWDWLPKLNSKVVKVGEAFPASGTPDYSAYITAILAAKPDAVFVNLAGVDDVNFIKQAKGFGFFDKVKYLGHIAGATSVLMPLGKDAPQGLTVAGMYPIPYFTDKMHKDFEQAFYKKMGNYDLGGGATDAYDQILLLAQAIKAAGSTDVEKVIDKLEGAEINGLAGLIKVLPYQHLGMKGGYVGVTGAYNAEYGLAPMTNVIYYPPDPKYFLSDDEVRKLREKK